MRYNPASPVGYEARSNDGAQNIGNVRPPSAPSGGGAGGAESQAGRVFEARCVVGRQPDAPDGPNIPLPEGADREVLEALVDRVNYNATAEELGPGTLGMFLPRRVDASGYTPDFPRPLRPGEPPWNPGIDREVMILGGLEPPVQRRTIRHELAHAIEHEGA